MQTVANPVVSVIMPVYNVERFLDQALASVEAQTLHDIEILCVNDGSTDGSLEILERHASRDARIRVITKPNGGYGSACNRGIQEARGTWIAIVEPDDWIDPAMYKDMVAYYETFDVPIDLVKTPYWRVIDADTPNQHLLNCSYKGRIRARQPFRITDKGAEHLLIHHPSIWSAIYRASFLQDKMIRFREIPGAGWADNPFLVETLCQARSIAYLNKAYYYYREETEEKTAAFAKNYMTVPFERWHDMMDVLERIEMRDEAVLKVQYRRGFTYLDYVASEIDANDPRVLDIMARMFARMDDNLVLDEPHISPAWKRRFLEVKGLHGHRVNPLPYAATLMGAGLYSVKNVGPAEALKLVGSVARHNRTAEGIDTQAEPVNGAGSDAVGGSVREGRSPKPSKEKRSRLPGRKREAPEAKGLRDAPRWEGPLTKTLSIVIPVYNAEPYLEECLSSLAAQTHAVFEAVCVDDGSTDRSRAVLDEWAARDGRFRVLGKPNGGPSSARNVGLRAATGDYVCFLDADDLLERNACQRILELAECLSCDCIVYGWSCFPAEDANEWLLAHTDVSDAFYPQFSSALLFEEMTNPFLRVAVKREVLLERGVFFDEALRVGEDSAFLFALFPRAGATKLIPDKLYRYRMPHEGSITDVSRDGTAGKCADDLSMMISIFQDWDRAGILKRYAPELMHWFISFLLYTMLRQPPAVRDPLVNVSRQLLMAHFTPEELYDLPLPDHDFKLIDVVLTAHDDKLGMGERQLASAMLAWRIAEYGPLHLAKTALERIR